MQRIIRAKAPYDGSGERKRTGETKTKDDPAGRRGRVQCGQMCALVFWPDVGVRKALGGSPASQDDLSDRLMLM